jgi:hypothetical protein
MIDINAMRNKGVAKPELNSLGKLNRVFDNIIQYSADFNGEAILAGTLREGLIISKFRDTAYTVIDSPYGVYLRFQEAIYATIQLELGKTLEPGIQPHCMIIPVFQRYLYDRLKNCHDGEELSNTLTIMEDLAICLDTHVYLTDINLSDTAQAELQIISEARKSDVKSDDILEQYAATVLKPMCNLLKLEHDATAIFTPEASDRICTFLQQLWSSIFETTPTNKMSFDVSSIMVSYKKLESCFSRYGFYEDPEPLKAAFAYEALLR